jgi:lysozyme family protein
MKFKDALRHVLIHEGGWSDHPADPGGATMKGVTLQVFREFKQNQFATKEQLREISQADLEAIYNTRYWVRVRADELPHGLDYAVFDCAVNSGVGRASRMLQECLDVTVDGIIGPKTLLAAGERNREQLIREYCQMRLDFLRSLRTWPTFGRGWARRLADVQHTALTAPPQ